MDVYKSLQKLPPYCFELAILAITGGFCFGVVTMIKALTHGT